MGGCRTAPTFAATIPLPGTREATPLSRSRTSAAEVDFRESLPWKMMSCMCSPRRLFALCSPSTQVIASTTLLLPQPLGPTMAVTPGVEGELGAVGEALEAGDFETIQTHI